MPQLETALPFLLDAVADGRLTCADVVERYAERPARLHGLYPRKGSLAVGADADFVVVDPGATWEVDASGFASAADYSPFDGASLAGRPALVYRRGERVAETGSVLADPGDGRRLPTE
jgi:dihydroorotase-like cyclic amidohydrolase